MNNHIFDLNESVNFGTINLGNPTLINNNNYFSKISHGSMKKNVYIQFPKCYTKQGIIKGNNKTYCDLNFNISDKNVIEFFENLEKFCIDKIYSNRELWFYESDSMEKNDIEELMTTIMKPYKHGKNFLVKTHIKLDKFNIYDENENRISLDDYDSNQELIPLVNINGIKFSSKNFTIEMILSQIMVIYPADEFEKQMLIKIDKKGNNIKTNPVSLVDNKEKDKVEDKNVENQSIEDKKVEDVEDVEDEKVENDSVENVEVIEDVEVVEDVEKVEDEKVEDEKVEDEKVEDEKVEDENVEDEKVEDEKVEDEKVEDETKLLENYKDNINYEDDKNDDDIKYLINNDLESVNILDIPEDDNLMELKTHESIYLEIYKKAKQKAKEIRKNAIEAFLEAKNIKQRYNLNTLDNSDSSDDEQNFLSN